MASQSYSQRTWRTACGRTKKYYVRSQASPTSLWTVAASADDEVGLVKAIERARAAHPGAALRVDRYTKGGERIEGNALDPTPAARAA